MNRFPDNKRFAFTIFDDTDLATVENVGPVYRLLEELGMRTTKSVWPLASVPGARIGGCSLQDPEYLTFIRQLQSRGVEISLHGVRNAHSGRQQILAGLEEFHRRLGHYPRVHANHSSNRENIYWGAARFTFLGPLYAAMVRPRGWKFSGVDAREPYFWGDICRDRISYVRNFVFRDVNLDRINPSLPYHDPRRPFVNAWFSSCDGANVERFCELLHERNQDRLEEEGGVCIVYAHFACGFASKGQVHFRAAELLRRLARKQGWFVPVSTLLDHLRSRRQTAAIPRLELARMEWQWLRDHGASGLTDALAKWRTPASAVPEIDRVPA